MRQSAIVVLVAAAGLALTGCPGKKPAAPPPAAPVVPTAPPPAPPPSTREAPAIVDEYKKLLETPIDQIERMGLLGEIHYEFDKADIRESDRPILAKNAEVLKKFDFLRITVEGHCDERGTVDYNIALGERRAKAAYDYLVSLGVPSDRLKTVSYGKEAPLCREQTEECWARNRRAHFAVTGKAAGR